MNIAGENFIIHPGHKQEIFQAAYTILKKEIYSNKKLMRWLSDLSYVLDCTYDCTFSKNIPSVSLVTLSNSPTHPFPQLEKISAIIPQLLRRKTDAKQKVKQLSPALSLLEITRLILIHEL